MLESCLDQGAGLRLQMPQLAPRLAALVGHGDTDTELPLLWQLCDAMRCLGYRVAVLDVSGTESAESPGLHGLLDGSHSADDDHHDHFDHRMPAYNLAVFPSRRGMASLITARGAPRTDACARLGRALRAYDLAVLFGSAAQIAGWAHYCAIAPVLPAAPQKDALLAASRSLKSLVEAGVVPTIASVVTRPGIATAGIAQAARDNLSRCATRWLGRQVDVMRVRSAPEGAPISSEVHRLALRLIEGAANLASGASPLAPAPDTDAFPLPFPSPRFDRPVRSH